MPWTLGAAAKACCTCPLVSHFQQPVRPMTVILEKRGGGRMSAKYLVVYWKYASPSYLVRKGQAGARQLTLSHSPAGHRASLFWHNEEGGCTMDHLSRCSGSYVSFKYIIRESTQRWEKCLDTGNKRCYFLKHWFPLVGGHCVMGFGLCVSVWWEWDCDCVSVRQCW